MTPSPFSRLEDTQAKADPRGVAIAHVGVSGLRWRGEFFGGQDWQPAVFTWRLGVELPADQRGTHMSRFVQWVRDEAGRLDPAELPALAESLRRRLDAPACRVELETELFRELRAPLSGEAGQASYRLRLVQRCREGGAADATQAEGELVQAIATLCPCSKAISARGAHNQRGELKLAWGGPLPLAPAELARLGEQAGSAPLYPVLKRADEKWVTELAYDQPAFVEDVVREATLRLRELGLPWFRVEVENFESIHQHNAWAVVEEGR